MNSDWDSAPERVWDTKNWLDRIGEIDNWNYSEDSCEEDSESDLELDKGIDDQETHEQRDVSPKPNVPGLIRPTWKTQKKPGNRVHDGQYNGNNEE